jgi:hypothetical protein
MEKGGKVSIWIVALLLLAAGAVAALAQTRIAMGQAPQQYLKRHDSASGVLARLAPYVDKDPNALYAVWDAMQSCSQMKRQWLRRRGMPPSERAFWRWQGAYCHHISRATEAYYYGLGVRVDLRVRHRDWDFSPGKEASYAQALYASILRDAPAPELRTASFALTYDLYGHVPWRYGRDTVAKARHPDRLPAYQRMAVRLVECDVMGGCDRNGLITFSLCREENDCRWGLSVNDILHERFEPDEAVIIETLHRRIVDDRASYTRTHAAGRRSPPLIKDRPFYGYSAGMNGWEARWNARQLVRISRRRSHAHE